MDVGFLVWQLGGDKCLMLPIVPEISATALRLPAMTSSDGFLYTWSLLTQVKISGFLQCYRLHTFNWRSTVHKLKVPIMFLFLCITPFAHAKFKAPENLQIVNSILSWDAVKNAAGYNIYLNDQYYATVKNSLLFELTRE